MRKKQPSRSLQEIGKTLAAIGAALALTPFVWGFVLYSISGEAWRFLVFVPIAILGGAAIWIRIPKILRTFEPSSAT